MPKPPSQVKIPDFLRPDTRHNNSKFDPANATAYLKAYVQPTLQPNYLIFFFVLKQKEAKIRKAVRKSTAFLPAPVAQNKTRLLFFVGFAHSLVVGSYNVLPKATFAGQNTDFLRPDTRRNNSSLTQPTL
ncbi:MAG: hypothetical protein IPL65_21650, partial [Lewinellaceae bacterium]|nr:hypothetical protein [Lewinellaceae bacterium]